MLLLLLSLFLAGARSGLAAETCESCVGAGHTYCVETGKCQPLTCQTPIKNVLNCPTTPQPGFEYTDDFGRNIAMPIIVAAGLDDPSICLRNAIPTATIHANIFAPCSEIIKNTTQGCHVYTAFDVTQKVIIISFRGTDGALQLDEEFESFFEKKEPFFNAGHVFKYFYDAFIMLWHQGLAKSVSDLRYLYPNFEIWVMGHSLGGALASTCASYLVQTGFASPPYLKLVTFGQPRTGDKDFAQWHDATFYYSYRIVNHHDVVSHIPPRGGPDMIWYNNTMAVGDPWTLCPEDDGHYCSNTVADTSTADHMTYFNRKMYDWAAAGCHLDQ